jgi:hypothetical protein
MKLGAAKHEAGRVAACVKVSIPKAAATTASLEFSLDRHKLRQMRRREGRYLLRTNIASQASDTLWRFYIQLTEVEQAFKELKRALAHGTTPRAVIDKFKTMRMVDVLLPTTDGRQLILSRYTQPEPEHRMLLGQLNLQLPGQPSPRITAKHAAQAVAEAAP